MNILSFIAALLSLNVTYKAEDTSSVGNIEIFFLYKMKEKSNNLLRILKRVYIRITWISNFFFFNCAL